MSTTERVYAASRIHTGLYVQPANDGERFFVIASYEDGRASGLPYGPWHATYWAWGLLDRTEAARIERLADIDPIDAQLQLRDIATGANTGYRTKRDAVEAALSSRPIPKAGKR